MSRPLIARLLTGLAMTLALVAPLSCSAATATTSSAATSGCAGASGVPGTAFTVAEYARSHGGAAQPGYVGNTVFQNREGHLDSHLGPFKEYDVHPKVSGQGRDADRVVLGPTKAASYYTSDHYSTFIAMYGSSCTG